MGLLLSHKRTVTIRVDAVSFSPGGGGGAAGGGKRGEVEGFSRAARKRMLQMLHSVKFQTAVLITLTYGKEYPEDWQIWKKHLKAWKRATERRYGNLRAIWRIELQKRGAPHFHVLYLDFPFIPVDTLQSLWYDIIKTPPEQRFGNGLDLRAVRGSTSHKQVMAYVSKYVGKIEDYEDWEEPPKIGRIWGHWNVEEEPCVQCELSEYEAKIVSEAVRSTWERNYYTPDDPTLCTLFGEELGTGNFQTMVKNIILAVSEKSRGKFGKKVSFITCNTSGKSL